MVPHVSHMRDDESLEAKARWFRSLPLEDRMQMLCEFTDLVLSINPQVAKAGRAQSSAKGIRYLTLRGED